MSRTFAIVVTALLCATGWGMAPLAAEVSPLSRLYTKPDSNASGGLKGAVSLSPSELWAVFAMPRGDPSKVYAANILNGRDFIFEGLPVGRYDLMVLYRDAFYEGLELSRDDSLTERDRELITEHIDRTGQFFETKEYHRMAGTTGLGNEARIVFQELHQREDSEIRNIKLGVLMQVGQQGWQMVRSREFVRIDVTNTSSASGILPHHYNSGLSGFRVVDSVRDVGTLR